MALPDVLGFERAGLDAWPGIEVDWDGNWIRRAARGYTKRANSLQCFDPQDGDNAEARLADGIAWFKARGVSPVVRTTPLASASLNAILDAQGWTEIDRSHLYAMPLDTYRPDADAQILDLLDPAFLTAQQTLQGHSDDTMANMRALLAVVAVPAVGVVVWRDGVAAASGLMAIANGIVVTGNVITDPGRRRQGLAAAMMRSGLAWAAEHGATIAALNVNASNTAAMALYDGLGYRHQYDYNYRIPRQA